MGVSVYSVCLFAQMVGSGFVPTDAACVEGEGSVVEADPASWGRDCLSLDLGLGSSRGLLFRSGTQALH